MLSGRRLQKTIITKYNNKVWVLIHVALQSKLEKVLKKYLNTNVVNMDLSEGTNAHHRK